MNPLLRASLPLLLAAGLPGTAGTNYDEAKVAPYTLPPLLTGADGVRIADARTWRERRRPELLALFREHVHGRTPGRPERMRFVPGRVDPAAVGGLATRREVAILLEGREDGPRIDLLLYLPNGARGPVPAFLGLNYYGNQSVEADPGITLSRRWMRPTREMGVEANRATEASRGRHASRWPLALALRRGYAVATFYYGDIEPDHRDGWRDGIRASWASAPEPIPPGESGAIAAWAWGLSRALDFLESEPAVDARRVAVFGHSRHGKTALWAGATDERFAMTVSNDSGEGGASLARRDYGERIADLARAVPHWFCARHAEYAGREDALPVDAHQLVALTAPRPAYIASAVEDRWADPRGEFLSAVHASPAWELSGLPGVGTAEFPAPDQPVGGTVGYHVRSGDHDITAYDWERFLDFADRHLRRP